MSNLMKRLEHANSVIAKYGKKGMHWGIRKEELTKETKRHSQRHSASMSALNSSMIAAHGEENVPHSLQQSYKEAQEVHNGMMNAYEHASKAIKEANSPEEAAKKLDTIRETIQNADEGRITTPKFKEAHGHVMQHWATKLRSEK